MFKVSHFVKTSWDRQSAINPALAAGSQSTSNAQCDAGAGVSWFIFLPAPGSTYASHSLADPAARAGFVYRFFAEKNQKSEFAQRRGFLRGVERKKFPKKPRFFATTFFQKIKNFLLRKINDL